METGTLSYWWICGLSALAGIVGFTKEFSWDDSLKRNSLKLLGRTLVSIFTGFMTLLFAQIVVKALNLSPEWILLAVGIGAWRGDKGLQVIADTWDKVAGKLTDAPPKGSDK